MTHATIASDEEMDTVFVFVDEHAPTPEAARVALIERAAEDWGYKVSAGAVELPERRWYRWDDDGGAAGGRELALRPCKPGDRGDEAARDSEWWVFRSIAPGDWEPV